MAFMSPLRCPRCASTGGASALSPRDAGGVRLEGCARCGGVFLARADVDRLLATLPADALSASDAVGGAPVDTRAPLACPVCARPMARTHARLAAIDLDRCGAHGTFYDRGEIRKLADALRGSTFRGAAAPSPAAPAAPAAKKKDEGTGVGDVVDGAAVAVGIFEIVGSIFD